MDRNPWIYIFIMSLVTLLIRILPLTLIRREIKNEFIRSFLHYVPYVTLSVMTFPAIIYATKEPIAGALALVFGAALAFLGGSLFKVAALSCVVVYITEAFLYTSMTP